MNRDPRSRTDEAQPAGRAAEPSVRNAATTSQEIRRSTRIGAWQVNLRWPSLDSEGPVELSIKAGPGADPAEIARGITGNVLRAIPLAHLTEELREVRRTAQNLRKEAVRIDGVAELIADTIRTDPTPGRRGRSEEFYALVAALYAWHVDQRYPNPVKRLADLCGASWRVSANWVRLAREKGFLTEGHERRPGGELTEKASEILDAML
ncbi:hypothetical protein J4573_03395 [Actinomadura barringtoniae]|uniref:Uncharacterized protein n=1 Tax=Actinomadura barringtoniae TaxID=1427535 RepID=A0A939P6A6_9ACTN|nr:hypothetical protein [Actinomadura barringtoniae]MBO2446120.1 hypothetical protein [Actinomadura barringtoniae]